jgi:hypothetical protein
MDVQDAIAIAIAAATAAWLGWSLWKRIQKPSCGSPTDGPPGSDGFVPLDTLVAHHAQGQSQRLPRDDKPS